MTSLIFGSIWLGHKGIIEHRREKQRQKNYERWEGLRDEYDEQKKITRQTRSLDIQRTGVGYNPTGIPYNPTGVGYNSTGYEEDPDKPILTLRDQQEANDARTSWRPQETWEEPIDQFNKRLSLDHPRPSPLGYTSPASAYVQSNPTGSQNGRQQPSNWSESVRRHKTGATWDDGLPEPLRVSRRSYDDGGGGQTLSRESSVHGVSRSNTASGRNSPRRSPNPATTTTTTTGLREVSSASVAADYAGTSDVEPLESHVPGGHMAQLIELGKGPGAAAAVNATTAARTGRVVTAPAYMVGTQIQRPEVGRRITEEPVGMDEWWNRA